VDLDRLLVALGFLTSSFFAFAFLSSAFGRPTFGFSAAGGW
jgi:hypothetical protein